MAPAPPSSQFALPPGPIDLADLDTVGRDYGPQHRRQAEKALARLGKRSAKRQKPLFAQATSGATDRLLVILQGMDTAGKDGVLNHVFTVFNPSGLRLAAFKAPTEEERAHDFLWRIERQVPAPGLIGVFNRSHYEDVLIVRVHSLVPDSEWQQRYAVINQFEQHLAEDGVCIVKCFLHVSREVQKQRLAARLADPRKYWKFNPEDLSERALWARYQVAYADALARCHTAFAPWYVVPADRKWYRNWAVGALVDDALTRMKPRYPAPDFDLSTERRRVAAS